MRDPVRLDAVERRLESTDIGRRLQVVRLRPRRMGGLEREQPGLRLELVQQLPTTLGERGELDDRGHWSMLGVIRRRRWRRGSVRPSCPRALLSLAYRDLRRTDIS